VLDPKWGVGSWIWEADKQLQIKTSCRFWRTFVIPPDATVARARLRIAGDDSYSVLLDGREIGIGSDWRNVTEYDISLLLKPGRHVLAVFAFNDIGPAGVALGLESEFTDGRMIQIPSDSHWRIVPPGENGWEKKSSAPAHWKQAVVVSAFGETPWRNMRESVIKMPTHQPIELRFWQTVWFQVVLLSVAGVAVLVCLRLMAQLTVQSRAQAMLQRERARIARDIHDELGARLTELALEGEVAQTEYPAGADARARFAALSEKARALSGALDEVVWMVNSRRDTLRDFATFACKHAQRFLASTPIRCRLDVEASLPEVQFELPVRRNLLLAVKEALNNAAKYSGATELFLRIHRHGQSVLVVVEDNGQGFDPELADPARNGLTNMNQRMQEIGGECRIVSRTGAGCRVEFQVPLPKLTQRSDLTGVQAEQPVVRNAGALAASPATPGAKAVSTR
jgi:signal transduction histidine kinase